jgi:hypothetical protein
MVVYEGHVHPLKLQRHFAEIETNAPINCLRVVGDCECCLWCVMVIHIRSEFLLDITVSGTVYHKRIFFQRYGVE